MTRESKNKALVLAAAQMVCADGDAAANLEHALHFVREAVAAKADLLVFPEFMPQGFRLTNELWDCAEAEGGRTEQWLKTNARQFHMHIGASFLQARGDQFVNTFVLAAPDGTIAGRVDKTFPSLWEAYFFTGGTSPHIIDTAIGRIGVGICFDNHTWQVAEEIRRSDVDIMIMPHSYFAPDTTSKLISAEDIERLVQLPGMIAKLYNRHLGVPVMMVNKSGIWDSPLPTRLLPKADRASFCGRSTIIDGDGTVVAQLDHMEGLAVAAVHADPANRKSEPFPHHSRYIYPGSAGREYTRFVEWVARRSYRRSDERRSKALAYGQR